MVPTKVEAKELNKVAGFWGKLEDRINCIWLSWHMKGQGGGASSVTLRTLPAGQIGLPFTEVGTGGGGVLKARQAGLCTYQVEVSRRQLAI